MTLIDMLVYTIVLVIVGFCVITIITTLGDDDV
jgi:hypothetical protein